jgi:chitinase domain-containing protein 1
MLHSKGSGIHVLLLLWLVLSSLYFPSLTKEMPKKTKKASSKTVYERGLVTEKVTYRSILNENKKYFSDTTIKNFQGTTLVYVTPWNNRGYDVAKIMNCKLDYVAPTWYKITRSVDDKIIVGGRQNIDRGWMADVRNTQLCPTRKIRIVPRFHLEGWDFPSLRTLFSADKTRMNALIQSVVSECVNQNFDGLVLDAEYLDVSQFGEHLLFFLIDLANKLHDHQKEFILVIPPIRGNLGDRQPFSAQNFAFLVPYVDYFSLMTYDYSSPQRPGPVSPLGWMVQSVLGLIPTDQRHHSRKILMGINFYGNDFTEPSGGGPIIGEQYLSLLAKHKPKFEWDASNHEHIFHYTEGAQHHIVYYPTLKSLHDRIELAKSLKVGLSIWEIGQGLDYWYDLL